MVARRRVDSDLNSELKLARAAYKGYLQISSFISGLSGMASAEEFAQLKKTVQELRRGQLDLILRLEVRPVALARP